MNLIKIPSRKRATLIQSGGGYIHQAIAIVQGLLLIPLYIKFIGEGLYGYWLASGGILVWLNFIDLGLSRLIVQKVAHYYGKKSFEVSSDYFISGFVLYLGFALIIMLVGYGLSYPLPNIIDVNSSNIELIRNCFQLAVVGISLKVLNDCLRGFGTALLRPAVPMFNMVFWKIAGLLTVILLLFNGYGLWSIPIGHLVTQGGIFIINLIYSNYLFRQMTNKFNVKVGYLKEYLKIMPSFMGGRLGLSLVRRIEPTLITMVLYPEIATAYVITMRAADIISQLLDQIRGATFTGFAHLIGENNYERAGEIARTLLQFLFYGGFIAFGIYFAVNESFIKLWVDEKHFIGGLITILIGLGVFLRTLQLLIYELMIGLGDIKTSSYYIFFEALFRLILMYALLNISGVIGVPIGMIVSCGLMSFILFRRLNANLNLKIDPIKPFLKDIPILATIFILSYGLNQLIAPYIDSWLKFVFASLFILLSFLSLSLINRSNRELIHSLKPLIFKNKVGHYGKKS